MKEEGPFLDCNGRGEEREKQKASRCCVDTRHEQTYRLRQGCRGTCSLGPRRLPFRLGRPAPPSGCRKKEGGKEFVLLWLETVAVADWVFFQRAVLMTGCQVLSVRLLVPLATTVHPAARSMGERNDERNDDPTEHDGTRATEQHSSRRNSTVRQRNRSSVFRDGARPRWLA